MVQFSSGCVAGGTGRAGQHPTEGAAAVTQQRLHNSSTTTRQFETIYLHHYRQFCASGMRTQHCYSQEREHKAPRAAAARAETRPQPPTPPTRAALPAAASGNPALSARSAVCGIASGPSRGAAKKVGAAGLPGGDAAPAPHCTARPACCLQPAVPRAHKALCALSSFWS